MIAAMLILTRSDVKKLRITDIYSLHRVVYDLFEDVRSETEKNNGASSGILFVDKGGDHRERRILILADRLPAKPKHGTIQSRPVSEDFLNHQHYRFEVLINPVTTCGTSNKIKPVRGREAVKKWFVDKASKSWGFSVVKQTLQINGISVKQFTKKVGDAKHTVTLGTASIQGHLTVTNRQQFIKSFKKGIGKGRAFGLGLLQLVPFSNTSDI